MLGIRTPSQTDDYVKKLEGERRPSGNAPLEEALSYRTALRSRIMKDWQANQANKTRVEYNMLECLRERKGEYSPKELSDIRSAGGSEIYIKLPTSKIRAGIAHVKSIMLPVGEYAHGIAPTSEPSLPGWMEDAIFERIQSNPLFINEEGQAVDPVDQAELLEKMAKKAIKERAVQSAKRMEKRINDQLDEGGMRAALSQAIDDLLSQPATFIKGPYEVKRPKLVHTLGRDGKYTQEVVYKIVNEICSINPFDAYPAAGVDSVHKGSFIERLRLNRGDLHGMMGMDNYFDDRIEEVLRDQTANRLHDWLWTDAARHNIAEHQYFWYRKTTEIDGLHWYGKAMGYELLEQGIDPELVDDPLREYEVDAILIGNHIIRIALNTDPLYKRPIHSSSYEKIPGSVFGNSPSMLMRSTTKVVNATARALQNNLAHASGFQVEIDYTRLHSETDPFDIHPFKIWQGRESEMTGDRPAVRFFQPESNADQLLLVMDKFKAMADSDTGIPEFLHGGQGGGEGADATARGRAMLLDQSAKLLRSSINNFDEDIVTPILEMLYQKNMRDPDCPEEAKGDAQVIAKGANAMLQREGARQNNMALLELLNNEVDQNLIGLRGRATVVRSLVDTFDHIDTDSVMPTDEELEQKILDIENAPPPPDPSQIKAESDLQIAQLANELKLQELQLSQQNKTTEFNNARILEQMRIRGQLQDTEARLSKNKEDEEIKAKIARLTAREALEVDIMKAKLSAEASARLKVAEMKLKHKTEITKMKLQTDTQRQVSKDAIPQTVEQPQFGEAEIKSIVESIVAQHASELTNEVHALTKTLTEKLVSENNNPATIGEGLTVHVNMPECTPSTKRVNVKRNQDGSMEGIIEPERQS